MEIDDTLRARLDRDEVVTSLVNVDGQERAQAIAVIDAEVAAVWDAITDYDRYVEFMPHTKESRILERKGRVIRFRSVLGFPVRDVWYVIRLTLNEKAHRVDWVMEEGNIKSNVGSWALSAYGKHRTCAVYTVSIDPGFFVPKFLLSKATQGTLPMLIRAVRDRAAATAKPGPVHAHAAEDHAKPKRKRAAKGE
ncbi:MAG: SRPBCC family protein [Planctomycetes bacterium]|nr:SRPBCC family protein [Planctomycetota bacterium]